MINSVSLDLFKTSIYLICHHLSKMDYLNGVTHFLLFQKNFEHILTFHVTTTSLYKRGFLIEMVNNVSLPLFKTLIYIISHHISQMDYQNGVTLFLLFVSNFDHNFTSHATNTGLYKRGLLIEVMNGVSLHLFKLFHLFNFISYIHDGLWKRCDTFPSVSIKLWTYFHFPRHYHQLI